MTGKQRGTPTFSGSNINPAFLSMTTWAILLTPSNAPKCRGSKLGTHRPWAERLHSPAFPITPTPSPNTHGSARGGGGGLKKEKRVPKGRIAQCKGVECEKVVNPITMNCLSWLLSGLFLTRAAGAPQGAPQAPQGCSPPSPLTRTHAMNCRIPSHPLALWCCSGLRFCPGSRGRVSITKTDNHKCLGWG